jgi:hypothetical protein
MKLKAAILAALQKGQEIGAPLGVAATVAYKKPPRAGSVRKGARANLVFHKTVFL